jgi:AraC-like DNA-binding protein
MNQFLLQQGRSRELELFPHIVELGAKKITSIRLNSFAETISDNLRIYYINDGKYEWQVNRQTFILYPGDLAIILPGQAFNSQKGYLEIGSITWMHIAIPKSINSALITGKWSSLSETESMTIGKILLSTNSSVLSKLTDAGRILQYIQHELLTHEIGYFTRINHLIDEVLITITRQLTKQTNPSRDFPKTFMLLEQTLRQNLSHQWTVEEMAAVVGMGTTLFNEKVKNYSGFTPINYLINIRISEAIKLLKKKEISLTDIALDTGFYSSQHFSTTFKKLTGYTPSEFRKNNLPNS